jgi:hypothetical protein
VTLTSYLLFCDLLFYDKQFLRNSFDNKNPI